MKNISFKVFKDNNSGVIHIPRLLAITIPFLIITIAHMLNAFGIGVPDILLDAVFAFFIIALGLLIAILGMTINCMTWFIIIIGFFCLFVYIYIQYVVDIIFIKSPFLFF